MMQICRCCLLRSDSSTEIANENGPNTLNNGNELLQVLEILLGSPVNMQITKTVCKRCRTKLRQIQEFRETCINSANVCSQMQMHLLGEDVTNPTNDAINRNERQIGQIRGQSQPAARFTSISSNLKRRFVDPSGINEEYVHVSQITKNIWRPSATFRNNSTGRGPDAFMRSRLGTHMNRGDGLVHCDEYQEQKPAERDESDCEVTKSDMRHPMYFQNLHNEVTNILTSQRQTDNVSQHSQQSTDSETNTNKRCNNHPHCPSHCSSFHDTRQDNQRYYHVCGRKMNHTCQICSLNFNTRLDLRQHITSHTRDDGFQCLVCGRKFQFKSQLTVHARSHLDEYPFKCDTCGQGFICHNSLQIHKQEHRMLTLFKCQTCERSLGHNHLLNIHTKMHQRHPA